MTISLHILRHQMKKRLLLSIFKPKQVHSTNLQSKLYNYSYSDKMASRPNREYPLLRPWLSFLRKPI